MAKLEFMLDNLPDDAYNKDLTSNIAKFLSGFADQLDEFVETMEKVKNSHYPDYATGEDLDKIGALLNLTRFSNESDNKFRGRIKAKVPSFIGGGTISAIRQVVKNFLGVNPVIIEHYKPGEEHAFFHNGVLNGIEVEIATGFDVEVKSGVAYIEGSRINTTDSTLTIESDSVKYLRLDSSGTIFTSDDESEIPNQIILAKITTDSNVVTLIEDKRFMLDPFEHYITNTATITVQIPYDFTETFITLEDTKKILKDTKAAGIALLVRVVGVYKEFLTITDFYDTSFMVGFTGMGTQNFI